MAERRPIVLLSNNVQSELPAGDTLPGIGGASSPPSFTAKDSAYTFVAGDAGKGYCLTAATARTYTIPANVFSAENILWVQVRANTALTLARGSGLTLYLAGSTNNANRIVGPYGMAAIYFNSPTVATLYGTGVG